MDSSHTKVRQTLVAFSCATILATYMDCRKASATTVESGVTSEQIVEVGAKVEETQVISEKIISEVPESASTENKIENVPLIVDAVNIEGSIIRGSGEPQFTLELRDENGVVIAKTVIDDQGLFVLEIPSAIAYQKLFIHSFNQNGEFIEQIEIPIEGIRPEDFKDLTVQAEVPKKTNEEPVLIEEQTSAGEEISVDKVIENPEVVSNTVRMMSTFSLATFSAPVVEDGKTYYYIQSGDTLNSLAKHFGVTSTQLQTWNSIQDPNNIFVGQIISVDGINVYDVIDKEDKTFATSGEFVDQLAQSAMKVAKGYNLYTSVMIAQGSLETGYGKSALALQGNNLFGIKGTYEGNSIVMRTWEEVDGKAIWINDYFRLYPSYYESLIDNAELLRGGTYWNPNFYNGTWVENTDSHKDATAWLTGRYATDSGYGTKLNNIIDYWDLTQYDIHVNHFDEIYSSRATDYQAKIIQGGHTLDTSPWGTEGSKTIANSSNYLGKTFQVVGEMETSRASWVKVNIDGVLLWMDKKGVQAETMTQTVNVDYQAKIIRSGDTLNTLPWGVEGYQTMDNTSNHLGETFKVTQETTTPRATWERISVGGKNLWVDTKALNPETMTNTKSVNYEARIVRSGDTISTFPWGVKGYSVSDSSTYHLNSIVKVIQETTTPRATWAQIQLNGKTLGWIDAKALETKGLEAILTSTPTVYMAEVIEGGHTLNSAPWGTKGFQTVGNSSSIIGKTVKVEEVATTARATWAKFYLNGRYVWIDKSGLRSETMTNTRTVNYEARIMRSGDSISSLPWGVEGFKVNTGSSTYLNQTVRVVQETTTPRAIWAQIQVGGKTLGWIDIKALDTKGNEIILTSRKTDYQAKIVESGHTLDTSPWGTNGFKTIAKSTKYLGNTVNVVEVATTVRATWAKFYLNGQYVWMDITGLEAEQMTHTVSTNYLATITRAGDTISTLPWGIEGYKINAYSNQYLNQKVTVLKETTTPRATWVYVSINGRELGWLDKKAISR